MLEKQSAKILGYTKQTNKLGIFSDYFRPWICTKDIKKGYSSSRIIFAMAALLFSFSQWSRDHIYLSIGWKSISLIYKISITKIYLTRWNFTYGWDEVYHFIMISFHLYHFTSFIWFAELSIVHKFLCYFNTCCAQLVALSIISCA